LKLFIVHIIEKYFFFQSVNKLTANSIDCIAFAITSPVSPAQAITESFNHPIRRLKHRRISGAGILTIDTSHQCFNLKSGSIRAWQIFKKLPAPLSLGILSACTNLGPDYQRPATRLQPAWTRPDSAQYSADNKVSDDQFWSSFNDKTLLEILRHAQSKSPTLKSAALQVEVARETIRINAAPQLPNITATGSRNYNQPDVASKQRGINDGSFTDQFLGQLYWELDFWG
jgi:hypothetical protein